MLGWPSVAWGEQHLGCAEFDEWIAYLQIEPPEPRRADWRSAMSAATIVNALLAMNGAEKRIQIADLLPDFSPHKQAEPQQDDEAERARSQSLLRKAEALNAMFGGKDLRNT